MRAMRLVVPVTFVALSLSFVPAQAEDGDDPGGGNLLNQLTNSGSNAPASDPPESKPPESDPPASNPPKSDPPASNPPKSDPPASNPPKSDPPESDPPKTESDDQTKTAQRQVEQPSMGLSSDGRFLDDQEEGDEESREDGNKDKDWNKDEKSDNDKQWKKNKGDRCHQDWKDWGDNDDEGGPIFLRSDESDQGSFGGGGFKKSNRDNKEHDGCGKKKHRDRCDNDWKGKKHGNKDWGDDDNEGGPIFLRSDESGQGSWSGGFKKNHRDKKHDDCDKKKHRDRCDRDDDHDHDKWKNKSRWEKDWDDDWNDHENGDVDFRNAGFQGDDDGAWYGKFDKGDWSDHHDKFKRHHRDHDDDCDDDDDDDDDDDSDEKSHKSGPLPNTGAPGNLPLLALGGFLVIAGLSIERRAREDRQTP